MSVLTALFPTGAEGLLQLKKGLAEKEMAIKCRFCVLQVVIRYSRRVAVTDQ